MLYVKNIDTKIHPKNISDNNPEFDYSEYAAYDGWSAAE
jgi:hypothetical protein